MSLHHRRDVWPVFILLAAASIQAQNTPSQTNSNGQVPTIKTEANVVLVDVVVTRGKGGPAVGLHKEDFLVSEDGHPQMISFFEEHYGGTVSPVALPPMPSGVFTNYATIKTADSINVLLLDSLNTQPIDQTYGTPTDGQVLTGRVGRTDGRQAGDLHLGTKIPDGSWVYA